MRGVAPITKNGLTNIATRGTTPMEKNVIVVDENGNEYGATYPKRARGLVKSGRARFIDDFRICLACPPNINEITEDIKMSENMNIEATETVEVTENTATKYTLDYVLEQIERLQKQITESPNHSLHRLGDAVRSIYANDVKESTCEDDAESCDGEESRMSSVACVCEIYRYREETLKQMLAFYEKMYDDLKPETSKDKQEKINLLLAHLSECQNDSAACYMGDELRRLMEN